jgi:hypothetical protein
VSGAGSEAGASSRRAWGGGEGATAAGAAGARAAGSWEVGRVRPPGLQGVRAGQRRRSSTAPGNAGTAT